MLVKICIISLLFCLSLAAYTAENQNQVYNLVPQQPTTPISITIQSNPVAHSSTNAVQGVDLRQNIANYIKPFLGEEMRKLTQEKIAALSTLCFSNIIDNKKKFAVATCFSLYMGLFCGLFFMNRKIYKTLRWGLWKETLTIDQMRYLSQKKLSSDLVFSIQEHYHVPDNLTDFLSPFVSFFNDVDKEIYLLTQLININRIVDLCKLSRIMPRSNNTTLLRQRIERLVYLKELLVHWITNYKITLNVPHDTQSLLQDESVNN